MELIDESQLLTLQRPQYTGRSLSTLLPAVSASLGIGISTRIHHDPVALQQEYQLPRLEHIVVVLLDGLGYWNLQQRSGHAPYLRSLLHNGINQEPATTCCPATTVAALATFGTGTCPGLTGMLGYTQRNSVTGELSQLIQWRNALPPLRLQRESTIFEQLQERGAVVRKVGLPQFRNSAMTKAALRGGEYVGSVDAMQQIRHVIQSAQSAQLTYFYCRDLDKIGHNYGWETSKWVAKLEKIDNRLQRISEQLPAHSAMIITADHGMLTHDVSEQIDIANDSALRADIDMIAGEPRSVMLYVDPNVSHSIEEIAQRWKNRLESLHVEAKVLTKNEVIHEQFYGVTNERIEQMMGDILVLVGGNGSIVDSRIHNDVARNMPGVHGSYTTIERDIPMLIDVR